MQWSFVDDVRLESLGSAKRNSAHGMTGNDDLDYNDELICNATVIISAAFLSVGESPIHQLIMGNMGAVWPLLAAAALN